MLRIPALLVCGAMLVFPQELPSDRRAIGQTITALNDPSRLSTLFAQDGDGVSRYAELRASIPARVFRILGPIESAHPVVTISHEPWGEADISLPNARSGIIFVGADVALSEGACSYEDARGSRQTKPLLFVLKRENGFWKIVSLRMLAR